MSYTNYSDEQRAQAVVYFEDILQSRDARQFKDKVKYSLDLTVRHLEKTSTITWATVLRWYVMSKVDRQSGVSQEYRRIRADQATLKSAV